MPAKILYSHFEVCADCIPSWQRLFPRDAHLHFLIFNAGVHSIKCFLNIYS